MNKQELEKHRKAAKTLKKAKKAAKDNIKAGDKLIDIANLIEGKIKENGAEPAFPVNLSLNEVAAHYTPKKNDEKKVKEDDILTIDIGVHIDGYIADSAITLDFGDNEELVKTPKKALEKAIEKINKKGKETTIKEIGSTIEYEIKKRGYKPVANLTGHGLKKYKTHTDPTIPNVKTPNSNKLKNNQVIAIEPFATDGSGRVKETSDPQIFNLKKLKKLKIRDRNARKLLKQIKEKYKTLPFAKRWLKNFKRLDYSLKKLKQNNLIKSYSPLKDLESGNVSQYEDTLIIKENSCEKIT